MVQNGHERDALWRDLPGSMGKKTNQNHSLASASETGVCSRFRAIHRIRKEPRCDEERGGERTAFRGCLVFPVSSGVASRKKAFSDDRRVSEILAALPTKHVAF